MIKNHLRSAAIVLSAGLALAACSTGPRENSAPASEATPGVTDKTITLGIFGTLTGPLGGVGGPPVWGYQLWADDVNAAGGVCGRKIELIIQDTAGDTQKAAVQYRANRNKILAIPLLGSAGIASGLSADLEKDNIVGVPASWAATLLRFPTLFVSGATYDVEMIDGVGYLLEQGLIKKGDQLGHIYLEGEFGENGLAGSEYAAKDLGLKVVKQQVKATDTDLSSAVTSLKSASVKAILVTGTATQTASAASVAASMGFNVPVLTNHNGYLKDLLSTPAADTLKKNLIVVDSTTPYAQADDERAKAVADGFAKKFPDRVAQASSQVNWGYSTGMIFKQAIEKACGGGELTRAGLLRAMRSFTAVTSDFLPSQNFSVQGDLPTKKVFIARPADNDSGLKVVAPDYSTPSAEKYQGPLAK